MVDPMTMTILPSFYQKDFARFFYLGDQCWGLCQLIPTDFLGKIWQKAKAKSWQNGLRHWICHGKIYPYPKFSADGWMPKAKKASQPPRKLNILLHSDFNGWVAPCPVLNTPANQGNRTSMRPSITRPPYIGPIDVMTPWFKKANLLSECIWIHLNTSDHTGKNHIRSFFAAWWPPCWLSHLQGKSHISMLNFLYQKPWGLLNIRFGKYTCDLLWGSTLTHCHMAQSFYIPWPTWHLLWQVLPLDFMKNVDSTGKMSC